MICTGEEMIHKLRVYLKLLRPFTLLAPLIVSSCVIVASLMNSKTTDFSFVSLLWTIISASFCFASLNGASNVLNQVADRKEDALSKPYRPIPRGIITPNEAYRVSFFLYAFALLLSLTVHILFSLFVFIIAFFSITYSLKPRMKKYLFFNQLWVALPRGFFGFIGSWSVFGNPFEPLPLAMGCIAALFLFGGTATKDILDADADRTVGTKTLVNVFGQKTAAFFSLFFMVGAFGLILPLVYFKIIQATFLPLAFLGILSVVIGWLMMQDHKNKKCENTSAWTVMYATYFIFALGFAVIAISFSA
ncbi:MAG TPA: 4-hydroxybenzoate polyprenyltransferase [Thermoplasmata archaeon]|nr:MAG TPA: 4-hydroxybenzoate polyprenyltransferase [Thermoplasmata archaeon]